ncbi:MAG: respiratory nitrate reductase subunit gamma [Actinomycetota bacterium]|nr:respiratory nitrate reductase subunit gamma [Actinomycetota bacterium]
MSWNTIIFVVAPYVAIVLAVGGTMYRTRKEEFSVSSLSTQLLENKKLFWGSFSFHWGILAILTAHFLFLIMPVIFDIWNGSQIRLFLLEITGFALAGWTLGGMIILIYRRLTSRRVQVVTSKMDVVILILLLTQIITGMWIALGYRFGSFWGTSVFVPYVWSLITLRPRPELVAPLPFVLQFHAALFWLFLMAFPFSRLVHIVTLPLPYLTRPWQKVVWVRRDREFPADEKKDRASV